MIASIDVLNNYLIIGCSDGRFYWLAPGEVSVDPLNFATAESSPDGLVAVCRLVDEIWLFGTRTRAWQATGNADAPFERAAGRVYDRGRVSRDTVCRFDNGIVWQGDDNFIYRSGAVPQRISTTGIEERLQRAATLVPNTSAWPMSVEGHKCYALRIPGQGTYVYDAAMQSWATFQSDGNLLWRAAYGHDQLAGSADSGEIWFVDSSLSTDAGVAFRKATSGTIGLQGRPQRNASASFHVGCSADTVFRVRWRDADEDFPDYLEEFSVSAPSEIFLLYRMGQGRQPYRTFEIENTDTVQVRISGATVNSGWQ